MVLRLVDPRRLLVHSKQMDSELLDGRMCILNIKLKGCCVRGSWPGRYPRLTLETVPSRNLGYCGVP